MSSGRGTFLSGIIAIGLFSILSVLGISWMLQPEKNLVSVVPRAQQQTPTSTPTPSLEPSQLTSTVERVIGGG